MNQNLSNFIKYCLGYINITRQRGFFSQQKNSVDLSSGYLNLDGLLNGDLDGKVEEIINLETFYSYDPKNVPEELKEKYQEERTLANKIEEIYNKYRNDQYRKQIVLHFGHFEIEIPKTEEENGNGLEAEELDTLENGKQSMLFEDEKPKRKKSKNSKDKKADETEVKETRQRYPLFSLPIRIEKEDGKYYAFTVEPEVQVNLGSLESMLGEEPYYQLLEKVGKYEVDEMLTLPINDMPVFQEVWHEVKNFLKLKEEIIFNEESFALEEIKLTLGIKANYFLAEDLRKLSEVSEDLEKTSLASWVEDKDLNISDESARETELYFPFPYDKHQVKILSLLKNKTFIVEGPPGTGKSQTISNLLCHLAATGKKVLFVSQKAQALKVVKDKLKTLGVDYLFGYIPNPASAQLNETDELDGIAPHLSAMNSYIEKLVRHTGGRNEKDMSLASAVEKSHRLITELNSTIETQREVYQLHQELKGLREYEMTITEFDSFCQCFSQKHWKHIKELKRKIEKLILFLEEYGSSREKRQFDKIFYKFDFNGTKYSSSIGTILDDVIKTGYDRHSKLGRDLNNARRNFRLRGIRKNLPREIVDIIDGLLKEDLSKKEAVGFLKTFTGYCQYYEAKDNLEEHKYQLKESLSKCGVSDKEFQIIDTKILETPSGELEDVKNKIVRVQSIKEELKGIRTRSQNRISSDIYDIGRDTGARVALYLHNIINGNISDKYNSSITVKQIVRRLASAFKKSKTAFKTFDRIRKDADNFNTILDLIPVWIMELDDASRIVPLEAGIFDYVILDEASQCNVAYTLPVMFRAKHAIFVGDSEQMRDNTIMFKSNKAFDDIARRYQIQDELRIKSTGTSVQSVLDIAYLRGFQNKALTYHYRSPKELIGFCNKNFYIPKGKELISLNSQYLTYKDTNRVMITHNVESDWSEEFSDAVNVAEAKAILELFKEMRSDERYRNKSIGILSFFNAQATYIRELLEKEGYKEEKNDYVVSIIDGIQGDEKDIIIYSFVIRSPGQKRMYIPLTGEGGDVQRDINMGRVNVAFSRARLQVHCFTSLDVEEIPIGIWIRKFLKYIEENGEIDFYSTTMKPFDSYFEEEFYGTVKSKLGRNYIIQNQVESCGFKLDFVISNKKNGKRIAVECDGPTHFQDELDEECGIYVESDQERQKVLEAAGWNFYRLRYLDWLDEEFDRESTIKDISNLLK